MAEVEAQLHNTSPVPPSENDPSLQHNLHHHEDPSLLSTLGEEIVRIISPVSACMLMVVLLVKVLNSSSSDSSSSLSIGTIAYSESASDSTWSKFVGALANSLVFVAVITAVSFLLVLLFYFRCTRFLKYYMAFSSFVALGILGGQIAILLLSVFSVPLDSLTFAVALFNFAVVGTVAIFIGSRGVPIVVTQGYLVLISVLVAYWFTLLPEWTSWALLLAMAVYDIAAVLLPGGPLRLLVELAISRDEEIPALVYEARPVVEYNDQAMHRGSAGRRIWRGRGELPSTVSGRDGLVSSSTRDVATGSSRTLAVLIDEEARLGLPDNGSHTAQSNSNSLSLATAPSQLTTPLVDSRHTRSELEDADMLDGIGLGMSGAIKLGLGDFIFYSVLVGRAAMYDFMTVYACYLAIIAGLGITLLFLAFYQKALPALPVSVFLGVLFYFLTWALLEFFVVQCSTNLVMF